MQSVHSGQSYQTSLYLCSVLEGGRKVHPIHSVLPADVRALDIQQSVLRLY